MGRQLLVTVRAESRICTALFDDMVQSLMCLGPDGVAEAHDAVVSMEAADGRVVVRPAAGMLVGRVSTGNLDKEPILLHAESPEYLCIRQVDGSRSFGLFVRRVPKGYGRFDKILFSHDAVFCIGRLRSCEFCYASELVSGTHARLSYDGRVFVVEDLRSSNNTFVNGLAIGARQPRSLVAGDVVQVIDLTLMIGCNFVLVNHPEQVRVGSIVGARAMPRTHDSRLDVSMPAIGGEPQLFYPSPRLSKSLHPLTLSVDPPPRRREEAEQPVLMQMGPSFFMGMASILLVASSVSHMVEGQDVLGAAPSFAMAFAMVGGSIVWPLVSRSFVRRQKGIEEMRRASLYVTYLDSVECELAKEARKQALVLHEARQSVDDLLGMAKSLSPLLMSRVGSGDDFLNLRVGIGDQGMAAEVSWPQRSFSLSSDPMLERVEALARRPPSLTDVPVVLDLARNHVSGVFGERELTWEFLRGLLVQICALYSYLEVKLILIADDSEREQWQSFACLGHLHDATGEQRLVALTQAGMTKVDRLIESELSERERRNVDALSEYGTYYVVVCANDAISKRSVALRRLGRLRENKGFSVVHVGTCLKDLPRECRYLIDLTPDGGISLNVEASQRGTNEESHMRSARMFERADVVGTLCEFDPDIMVSRETGDEFSLDLARILLDEPERQDVMPNSVGFLEMFEVGNVAHLNIGQRWAQNDASRSLQTPVGLDGRGLLSLINLHEDVHGPHALIAGTTGSGKSEFIITLILSLCVNYSPDEVSFVLIDYKGGGLAGAFCNDRHHLPHLAGVITNLDGSAIRRSLVAIRSELKRRQDVLNVARERVGEATMDIHKYLSLYRQGMLRDPLPHLFVIADEFAELKQQEPEFMEELVSAARIGRSLGVHLVLATQKPSGVVDDQIWSNARLKVSLKVSDIADSREMLKRDEAATISRPGQYWMLVGYNEWFGGGQAAFAGAPYVPSESFEPTRNTEVELMDGEGAVLASLKPALPAVQPSDSQANEVLTQIQRVAERANKRARRLWLPPLPSKITLDELHEEYGDEGEGALVCVIGEADDPYGQRKFELHVDLVEVGNVLLYGSQSSGVEDMLRAMALFMARRYAADSLCLYGIDFGDGSLLRLDSLPQTGGIVLGGDSERLESLLRMLEGEIVRRRRLLAHAEGGPCKSDGQTGDPMQSIVVCVVNLGALTELHPAVDDRLVSLTRDASRYGIHFLVTATTAGTPRMRLRSNFGLELPTMLNDPQDYLTILGGLEGMVVPHQRGRGIIRTRDGLYEFQGASVARSQEDEAMYIRKVALMSSMRSPLVATPIPQLPRHVYPRHMLGAMGADCLPVGYSKRSIEPVSFGFGTSSRMLVLANDNEAMGRYLRGVWQTLAQKEDKSYAFVDPLRLLGDSDDPHVLRSTDEVEGFVARWCDGKEAVDIVVFTSIVRTLGALGPPVLERLRRHLTNDLDAGESFVVVASEAWRTKSIFDDWYKSVSAQGNGIWVGAGFAEQTAFGFSRMLPEYQAAAGQSDGFVVCRGAVEAVRLVGPEERGGTHEG